jgi:hypothetical protein
MIGHVAAEDIEGEQLELLDCHPGSTMFMNVGAPNIVLTLLLTGYI